MKNIKLLAFLILLFSCQKDNTQNPISTTTTQNPKNEITIKQAEDWLQTQKDSTYLKKYPIRWQHAKSIPTTTGNRIQIYLPGQPTFQNIKQGYRQLSIQINPNTNQIEGKLLEIIPDALYFQGKQKVDQSDFTGRILGYDLNYKLQKGGIYSNGKQIGETRAATETEKQAFRNLNTTNTKQTQNSSNTNKLLGAFDFPQNQNTPTAPNKTARIQAIQNCQWVQSSYLDAEGIFNVQTERICSTYLYDDGTGNYNDQGINYDPNQGGGGGSSSNNTTAPEPSNLPGENSSNVDPKKMTKCFATIPNEGAAFQVKVLVVEPFPGTSFNVGPNSFGHVAIQLTKVKGDQSITQVVGFYGSGTGLDKLVSNSTLKDNSDIEYNLAASYFTDATNFQKILDYVGTPPNQYHYTQFNCTNFAYQAAQAGGLPVPNPTTSFGMPIGAMSGGNGMSPAGMAAALRTEKATNPNANISQGGGTAPPSKGECNEE